MEKSRYTELRLLYNQLTSIHDSNLISQYVSGICPKELYYLKYKLVYTLFHLISINICTEMADNILPDVNKSYNIWRNYNEEEVYFEDSDWFEELDTRLCEFDDIAQTLLKTVFINTSWDIAIIIEAREYEYLPDHVIKRFQEEVSLHCGTLRYIHQEEYDSKRLSNLGCDETCLGYYVSYGNVYVTNSKVNELLKLVKENPDIKKDTLYKEIISILEESLFHCVFPDLGSFFTKDSDLYYECYALGRVFDTDEFCSFYHLNYGQIVGFFLVEEAVNSLLSQYKNF